MFNLKLLKKDISDYYKGVIAFIIYFCVTDSLFGTCCPLRLITGYPCPACGTTRSAELLLVGQFRAALWYQPAILLLVLFGLAFVVVRYVLNKSAYIFKYIFAAILVVMCVVYAFRMVKYFPDTEPYIYTENNLSELMPFKHR